MQELAPGVWAHVIDAEGFPTVSAVVLSPRLAIVVDTLTELVARVGEAWG